MTQKAPKIAVLGGGSWGSTLALLAERAGNETWLWIRNEETAATVQTTRKNDLALPDAKFPASIVITPDISAACEEASVILIAVASAGVRSVAKLIAHVAEQAIVVSCAKGFERSTLKRMTQVLKDELSPPAASKICALSGPNLALEIAERKPSTTVIAGEDLEAAERVQEVLGSSQFRLYTNEDVVGVEMAGALKNIIAIGAGIGDGLAAGDNAKAAFITRGLSEIARLGVAAGANPLTFAGLAGLGDLIATCASSLSRNHFVGEQLAQGRTLSEIQASVPHVAEGIFATSAAKELAGHYNVEMPITNQLFGVLYEDKPALAAIAELTQRDSKHETRGVYDIS